MDLTQLDFWSLQKLYIQIGYEMFRRYWFVLFIAIVVLSLISYIKYKK